MVLSVPARPPPSEDSDHSVTRDSGVTRVDACHVTRATMLPSEEEDFLDTRLVTINGGHPGYHRNNGGHSSDSNTGVGRYQCR